jgi:D-alanyl-D-alanine carboxypeptidase
MNRLRDVRLNDADYELIPTPGRRRTRAESRRGEPAELRRKADDRVLARIHWRVHGGRVELDAALPRDAARETRRALLAMARLAARHVAPRGRVRVHGLQRTAQQLGTGIRRHDDRRIGRPARAAPIRPGADYAQRTGLPRQAEPRVLAFADVDAFGRRQWLAPRAAAAWRRLRAAAHADGVALELVSCFRHRWYQERLIRRKLARGLTLDEILRVNAAPGYSEHHSGRALDVTTPGCAPAEEIFETTEAFRWLVANAARFGFRLSYPRDNPHGVIYEPWHWYYAGTN